MVGGVGAAASQQHCAVLQLIDLTGRFLVCFLFHCSVLQSFNDYLVAVMDVQSLLRGLAAEFRTIDRVPGVE